MAALFIIHNINLLYALILSAHRTLKIDGGKVLDGWNFESPLVDPRKSPSLDLFGIALSRQIIVATWITHGYVRDVRWNVRSSSGMFFRVENTCERDAGLGLVWLRVVLRVRAAG
jgi:hypothetical protein